ncbi:carboxylesterase family protein [Umezawaea endophytica]|uniref:Carboxylesterase family protein n=1 Tax=Umezawaea endophytica TaxID=1654476 RepID=A0A9X2VNA0_9PSEU|nr:carboxylesterase family protein [Umezawaea endophytica]MCS7479651.1 carboxylesterase family protein [Umezawaea endophytica]
MIGSGRVRGFAAAPDVVAHLGIPFGEPPFGLLRFAPPRPVAGWSGVRDCTRFGPVAPQSAVIDGLPRWRPGEVDVLTVNVWAPVGARGLPVLFWVHGGANAFGSGAQRDFDGTALARRGLVVVTGNHRLGFEGFGHVAGFPDNRGLLDLAAALRWVREEIAAFGGDPALVTAAGQSSGATSVACLTGTGLLDRAILHSPPDLRFTPAEAAARFAGFPLDTPAVTVAASDRAGATYQPVLEASPLSGVPDAVPLLLCHTANEEPLFTEPVRALAARHPRAHLLRFAIPPARHNDEIAYAFGRREDTRLRDAWVRFAAGGDPGWGSETVLG